VTRSTGTGRDAVPARELRVWLLPRARRSIPTEWHSILAEVLRLGDKLSEDLKGTARELWHEGADGPSRWALIAKMREVRLRSRGQPYVLETKAGPLFIVACGPPPARRRPREAW
jgi:hypothetical protein